MSNQIIAWIRTVVPVGVGALVSFLVSLGVQLAPETEAALVSGLTGVVAAVYYTLIQWLSARWEWVGWLLGHKAQPHYESTKKP